MIIECLCCIADLGKTQWKSRIHHLLWLLVILMMMTAKTKQRNTLKIPLLYTWDTGVLTTHRLLRLRFVNQNSWCSCAADILEHVPQISLPQIREYTWKHLVSFTAVIWVFTVHFSATNSCLNLNRIHIRGLANHSLAPITRSLAHATFWIWCTSDIEVLLQKPVWTLTYVCDIKLFANSKTWPRVKVRHCVEFRWKKKNAKKKHQLCHLHSELNVATLVTVGFRSRMN